MPAVTAKEEEGTTVFILNALLVILRQVMQWQRPVPIMESKVRREVPQRQDAVGILLTSCSRGVSGSSLLWKKTLTARGA